MTKQTLIKGIGMAGAVLIGTACNDPTEPTNEQELITRVVLTLTPVGGGANQTSTIDDPDGLGPQAPSAPTATFTLAPGETYDGAIRFEDASDPNAIDNITAEVQAEAEEHRVFYVVVGGTGVSIPDNTLDTDANGAPLGVTFQVVVDAGATGSGTIQVVLSHFDEEPKGNGSQQSDETDADVTFDFTVQ